MFIYLTISPQAIRSPALPAGSLFISSAWAWMTNAVPPPAKTELPAGHECHSGVDDGRLGHAVGRDCEIVHVAGVWSLRVLQPMLLAIGIEMRARGFECRGIALRHLMDVEGMLARGQILEIERNRYSSCRLCRKCRSSDGPTLRIFEGNDGACLLRHERMQSRCPPDRKRVSA